MNGIFLLLLVSAVSSLCSPQFFLWIVGIVTMAIIIEKKIMHLFLRSFMVKILYAKKLKQSNTFPYRCKRMIATNNARTREVCCQA